MADLIKKIKIKKQDGTFTDYIPIGAEAQNISTTDGDSVQFKLNKKPYYYDTVADMKADTKLKNGDMAITLGYYEPNDGGGAEYKIINGNYIDDGGSYHELNNGLWAELIINNKNYYIQQFGAKSDGITDSSQAINNCFAAAVESSIVNCEGTYAIGDTIILPIASCVTVKGGSFKSLNSNGYFTLASDSGTIRYYYTGYDLTIDGVTHNGDYKANGLFLTKALRVKVQNCTFKNFYEYGIKFDTYESHDNIIDGCFFLGKESSHEPVESTGIILNKPDNQISNCVFASSKWAVKMLTATNMITNCHFYCNNTNDGGNLYVAGGRKIISHCYFDGSGIEFHGASNVVVDSCLFLVSDVTRGSLFNFKSTSNISIDGIQITNAVVADYRRDTSIDFELFSINHGVTTATGNICEIRTNKGTGHLIQNNPLNIFTWTDSSVASFSLMDDIELATIDVQSNAITSHGTTNIEAYYDDVKILSNMVETHYIGSTTVYRWVLIPFYISGKASIKIKNANTGNIEGRIYNSNYELISENGKFSTFTPGKYYFAAYRSNKYIINN